MSEPRKASVTSETQSVRSAKPTKRPRAKSSNPDYTQITAYIRKDTYTAVKRKLLDQTNPEFSETLEELLRRWVET